jgi:hypothetical protein
MDDGGGGFEFGEIRQHLRSSDRDDEWLILSTAVAGSSANMSRYIRPQPRVACW